MNYKYHVCVLVRPRGDPPVKITDIYSPTKFVQIEADPDLLKEYPPIAKIIAFKTALEIFSQTHFLLVDPDVVFTYDPRKKLENVMKEYKCFASDCTSYLKPEALSKEHANLVYRNRDYDGCPLGGAQYLIAPGQISTEDCAHMLNTAMHYFRKTNLWISEMLAWTSYFGPRHIRVHPDLNFKLADGDFSFGALAAGNEVLMIHQAGDVSKKGTFDKSLYKEISPFDDLDRICVSCQDPTLASYFYTLQMKLAQRRKK